MIEVSGLSKDFGNFRAVDDVSFSVPSGQVLGFLGPNGAGKSTTMKMLTCFIEPTSGSAKVNGKSILNDALGVRREVGYLPESAPSYGEMTVSEFLTFIVEMRSLGGSEGQRALDRIRDVCFLAEVWQQPIETLSKGYRQRVGFAQALIHDPPVLVLDEPTDGLDPNQKHEVRELIKRMGADKTIILSTHILEEVEAVCDRAIIIAHGRLVADSTPTRLMEQSSIHNAVRVKVVGGDVEKARSLLSGMGDVERIEDLPDAPGSFRVFPKDKKPIVAQVSQIARDKDLPVEELHVEHGRLDEVFRKVTTQDLVN